MNTAKFLADLFPSTAHFSFVSVRHSFYQCVRRKCCPSQAWKVSLGGEVSQHAHEVIRDEFLYFPEENHSTIAALLLSVLIADTEGSSLSTCWTWAVLAVLEGTAVSHTLGTGITALVGSLKWAESWWTKRGMGICKALLKTFVNCKRNSYLSRYRCTCRESFVLFSSTVIFRRQKSPIFRLKFQS